MLIAKITFIFIEDHVIQTQKDVYVKKILKNVLNASKAMTFLMENVLLQ